MQQKHIVNFSGGKDSTAMLLIMLEKGMPVDIILFADTGKEFPQMYEHINKVENFIGRKIIKLKSEKSFDYYMFDHQTSKGKYMDRLGHGWPTMRVRWCTSRLKIKTVNKYLQELKKSYEVIQYIGIAADEKKRAKDKKYPLIEWGMTESDCLNYCYNKGFDWGGLYQHFDRVSCWCCPLQNLKDLRNLWEYYPELWSELKEMDAKAYNTFRTDYSFLQLEKRFQAEKKNESMLEKLRFF